MPGARAVEAQAAPLRDRRVRVTVCIATFRRPLMLRALLKSLGDLRFSGPRPALRVVVVDNDVNASARPVVEHARAELALPLRYEVEPERNIARARNRCVAAALGDGADFIAFVDDDETVRPDWLDALLAAQRRLGADVVAGAVRARPGPTAAAWVVRSGLLGTRELPTGSAVSVAHTSNVLVAARLLAGPAPFNPEFGLSGGSDSVLFTRLNRQGARMVWCEDAVVDEVLPPSRAAAGWILQRAFRVGNCALWCERALGSGMGRPARRSLQASARLAFGLVQLLAGVLRGRAGLLRALWSVSYGAGALAALIGYRYVEYRTIHGE